MKELFEKYNISVDDKKLEKFEIFSDFLVRENEKYNLTAITDKKNITIKHFIDSVLIVDKLKGKIIDIGSGAGFPAIPIKILRDDIDYTLVDATEKKCNFISETVKKLDLKNVSVISGRAEELARDNLYREKFDFCTARAVAPLNILSEYCLPFIKVGGYFVSYKANYKDEIESAKNAIEKLGGKIESIDEFNLEGEKRAVIFIKKIATISPLFPRKNAQIKKRPL